jgi:hypothetical protein
MKITILILGLLFGALAVWALIETFRSHRKSAPQPRSRVTLPASANPQALVATDPYGAGKMRRGVRETLPPGQRFR